MLIALGRNCQENNYSCAHALSLIMPVFAGEDVKMGRKLVFDNHYKYFVHCYWDKVYIPQVVIMHTLLYNTFFLFSLYGSCIYFFRFVCALWFIVFSQLSHFSIFLLSIHIKLLLSNSLSLLLLRIFWTGNWVLLLKISLQINS